MRCKSRRFGGRLGRVALSLRARIIFCALFSNIFVFAGPSAATARTATGLLTVLPAVLTASAHASAHARTAALAPMIERAAQPLAFGPPSAIGGLGDTLFLAFEQGFFRSIDGGAGWEPCVFPDSAGSIPPGSGPFAVAHQGGELWLAFLTRSASQKLDGGPLYRSQDGGRNWSGQTWSVTDAIRGLASRGDTLIVYGSHCRYLPADASAFRSADSGLAGTVESLVDAGGFLYAATSATAATGTGGATNAPGVFRLAAFDQAWRPAQTGLPANSVYALAARAGRVYALAAERGLYSTDAAQAAWAQVAGSFGDLQGAAFFASDHLRLLTADSVFDRDETTGGWKSQGYHGLKIRVQDPFPSGARVFGMSDGAPVASSDAGVSWRPMDSAGLRENGRHALMSALDWGGKRFLHYGVRTYWTADAGRTWKSRGWSASAPNSKMPSTLMTNAIFKATSRTLFLQDQPMGSIYAYDPAAEDWRAVPWVASGESVSALGCDTNHIYILKNFSALMISEDEGSSFREIVLPDSLRPNLGFVNAIEAKGDRILLRCPQPSSHSIDLASMDAGKSWIKMPDSADCQMLGRRFYWVARGRVRSESAPGGSVDSSAAPFRYASFFAQSNGLIVARGDAGTFVFDSTAANGWQALGSDWAGWSWHGEVFSHQNADSIAWLPRGSATPNVSALRAPGARLGRPGAVRLGPGSVPPWLQRGRRPDGRAVTVPLPFGRAGLVSPQD